MFFFPIPGKSHKTPWKQQAVLNFLLLWTNITYYNIDNLSLILDVFWYIQQQVLQVHQVQQDQKIQL